MGSAMVPLDRALLSSYRQSIVTIPLSITVLGATDPQISLYRGGPGPLSNTMLLKTTRMFLPNGISFRPTVLAGYTSVADRLRYGNTCRSRPNSNAMPPNNGHNSRDIENTQREMLKSSFRLASDSTFYSTLCAL